jgi:ferredoxin-thioredoxin reductase catalytic subunit
LGYKFSPDEEEVDFLLEQEVLIEAREGSPYCPCQGHTIRMFCSWSFVSP